MNFFLTFTVLCICIFFLLSVQGKADEEEAGERYLAHTASLDNVITLKSGMLIEYLTTTTKTDAKSPTASDSCKVTYLGTFKDGAKFDGGTTSFAPNQVIKGWTEAMQYMAEGDKWKLHIPYGLAYGARGRPPKIPAYSVLVFEIEIHAVLKGGKSLEQAREMLADNIVVVPEEL